MPEHKVLSEKEQECGGVYRERERRKWREIEKKRQNSEGVRERETLTYER